jgi:hypothetical protein
MAEAYTTAALLTTSREGLRDIGYQDDLLREEYKFADILAQNQPRKIELAAFAQEPPSYLSSCIGIAIPPEHGTEAIMAYRSLGAPQILALHPENEKVLRWKILAHSKPELLEVIEPAYLRNAILTHKDDWQPEEVLRAKSIRFTGEPIQLDFFDIGLIQVIEEVVHKKLDELLLDILALCRSVYQEYHDADPNYDALVRLVFRLIAAKLLGDRQHSDKWLSSNAQEVIREVENFYFRNTPPQPVLDDIHVQNAAWKRIRSAFSFQNLSVEALAYIYENTLVNPDIRKKLGIHATAYLIAEYIVQQLPFKDLPLEECRVFEPFAGHAPFLIAALSKLRTMLQTGMSIEQRHDYFVRMLSGMEYEAFACEVAGYSLILADYPNPNGWRIEKANVFTSPKLNDYLTQANIVLCNPPYEYFPKDDRQAYPSLRSVNKAVEALNRVLERSPRMLGFVLPRTFVDGQMYVEVRKRIAKLYNNISLVALPDNAFNYSGAETVLLIAHGERTAQPSWKFALVDRKDYKQFLFTGQTTWQVQAPTSYVENQINRNNPNFWYTPMHPLWDALATLPRLESIADVHRGIEYKSFRKNKEELVSDVPHEGFAKGLRLTTKNFEPYVPRHFTYFNMNPEKMLYEAYKLPWEKPKVIANAGRIRSDRWVIASVVDEQGLVCYQNFHGIWPIANIPVEVIAALLNSPVANAFLSTHRSAWHNRKDTITQIPIPELKPSQIHLIVSLVREYMFYRKHWEPWLEDAKHIEGRCRGIIKQIDAELLASYNLPTYLELDLLEYFNGYERPGPFSPAQLNASPTKRLYTSLMRVEDVRSEDGNEVVEVALMNWNPHLTVRFPVSLVPHNLRAKLGRDVLLLAEVNVGAKKAEDLSFEAIRLAPELDPNDGLA